MEPSQEAGFRETSVVPRKLTLNESSLMPWVDG